MTTAYTSLLGLALPVTGELSGTWGDTVNNSITSLLDSAIAGTQTLTADTTLTTTTGAANQSRQAILLCSPASANITITAPAQSKIYTVINTSAVYTVTIRGVGPTTGVTLAVSESAVVAWNGSDFIRISSNSATTGNFTVNGNLVVTGNTTLGDADTDTITQAASYVTGTQLKSAKTATNTLNLAAYDTDGAAYTNLITLTASTTPTLALTSTGVGTINNMSIGATTASTGAFTTLSATGVATFSAGTAALPAITTTGDTNTGIFFPAADTIAASTAGSERMRIDSAGNLGIGVTPATYSGSGVLGINIAQTGNGILGNASNTWVSNNVSFNTGFKYARTAAATLYNQSAGSHVWSNAVSGTAGNAITFTDAMTLDASGNLGIGTTSPSSKLYTQLSSATAYSSGVTGNGLTIYNSSATTGQYVGITLQGEPTTGNGGIATIMGTTTGSGNMDLTFSTRGSATLAERMRIDSSGNLLIGTTSGSYQLTMSKAGQNYISISNTTNTLTSYMGVDTTGIVIQSAGAYPIKFLPNNTEAMRIDSSGNVGIGTSSPAVKLHVSGGTQRIQSTGSTSNAFLTLQNDVGTQAILGIVSSGNSPASSFYIETNAGKTVYVDSNGKMLLGATAVTYNEQLKITFSNTQAIHCNDSASSSSVNYLYFTKGATPTNVGAIYYNGSVMAYQTTSDYRLKENIAPMTGALAKIAALKPVTYTWKDNQQNGEGFIAHELQEHFPDAVSGIKDDVDENGNPKYQGMDASILIATLTAAIQEQQALITSLTARITALESN